MDSYHVAPAGNGFQVVENLPDGRVSTVGGFPILADAQEWLESFVLLLGLVNCMAEEPSQVRSTGYDSNDMGRSTSLPDNGQASL